MQLLLVKERGSLIGKLKGLVDSMGADHVIIDVGGVGYLAFCSGKTLAHLESGTAIELLIETHVREDHIHLYGFRNQLEKDTFLLLQSVKGVGNKMALNILSGLSPEDVQMALSAQNKEAFSQVSGVGKKLAERIVTELKDKFISDANINLLPKSYAPVVATASSDAISALVSLGINKADAQNRVNNVLAKDASTPINELIRLALKQEM